VAAFARRSRFHSLRRACGSARDRPLCPRPVPGSRRAVLPFPDPESRQHRDGGQNMFNLLVGCRGIIEGNVGTRGAEIAQSWGLPSKPRLPVRYARTSGSTNATPARPRLSSPETGPAGRPASRWSRGGTMAEQPSPRVSTTPVRVRSYIAITNICLSERRGRRFAPVVEERTEI
jgi:hypothetical protein